MEQENLKDKFIVFKDDPVVFYVVDVNEKGIILSDGGNVKFYNAESKTYADSLHAQDFESYISDAKLKPLFNWAEYGEKFNLVELEEFTALRKDSDGVLRIGASKVKNGIYKLSAEHALYGRSYNFTKRQMKQATIKDKKTNEKFMYFGGESSITNDYYGPMTKRDIRNSKQRGFAQNVLEQFPSMQNLSTFGMKRKMAKTAKSPSNLVSFLKETFYRDIDLLNQIRDSYAAAKADEDFDKNHEEDLYTRLPHNDLELQNLYQSLLQKLGLENDVTEQNQFKQAYDKRLESREENYQFENGILNRENRLRTETLEKNKNIDFSLYKKAKDDNKILFGGTNGFFKVIDINRKGIVLNQVNKNPIAYYYETVLHAPNKNQIKIYPYELTPELKQDVKKTRILEDEFSQKDYVGENYKFQDQEVALLYRNNENSIFYKYDPQNKNIKNQDPHIEIMSNEDFDKMYTEKSTRPISSNIESLSSFENLVKEINREYRLEKVSDKDLIEYFDYLDKNINRPKFKADDVKNSSRNEIAFGVLALYAEKALQAQENNNSISTEISQIIEKNNKDEDVKETGEDKEI